MATGAGYARRFAGRADLDSAWSVFGVSAIARAAARLVPVRRLDAVEVIGASLARKLTRGLGLRPIAAQLAVPHTTVRSWWQCFQARRAVLLAQCTALAVALDGTPVEVNVGGEHAALDALGVAWQRALARFGVRIGDRWSFWSRISGGQALATHTTSPWATRWGADWMTSSPVGGPAP